MRIVCVGYREWASRIYEELAKTPGHEFLILNGRKEYDEGRIVAFRPDLVLFYGWSWYVAESLLKQFTCLMLHPAPLPRYRGGSPIQNQIIDGLKDSAVSLFVMTAELDAGDLVGQEYLSLEGSLDEIFERISAIGLKLTQTILRDGLVRVPQDSSKATYCKRRSPADSEITAEELRTASAEYLYNKVRMLADPYPNAFIRTQDGRRLLIKQVEISPE